MLNLFLFVIFLLAALVFSAVIAYCINILCFEENNIHFNTFWLTVIIWIFILWLFTI